MTNTENQFDTTLPARLGIVTLNVTDLDRSLPFYLDTLGFQLLHRNEEEASLTADGKNPLLVLQEGKDIAPRPKRSTGLFHVAILLPSRKELGRFLQYLLANHIPVDGASDHLYSEAVYLTDPDGNGIEVYADRHPSKWKRDDSGDYIATIQRMLVDDVLREAGDKAWKGLPERTIIGHIHLTVDNLAKASRFYHGILGLDIMTRYNEQAYFLSKDNYHHHIAFNIWSGTNIPPSPPNSAGLALFTLFLSENEQKEIIERCESEQYPYEQKANILFVTDPYGHIIHIRKA